MAEERPDVSQHSLVTAICKFHNFLLRSKAHVTYTLAFAFS